VGLINAEFEKQTLPYRIADKRDIQRIYAGHWQRSAGAARWFADASAGDSGRLEVVSFDTMRDCVRRGVTLYNNRVTYTWEVVANDKNGKAPATAWP